MPVNDTRYDLEIALFVLTSTFSMAALLNPKSSGKKKLCPFFCPIFFVGRGVPRPWDLYFFPANSFSGEDLKKHPKWRNLEEKKEVERLYRGTRPLVLDAFHLHREKTCHSYISPSFPRRLAHHRNQPAPPPLIPSSW